MRIVAVKGDVAEQCQAVSGGDETGRDEPREAAARMQRQQQPERENQQHRRTPSAEIKDIGGAPAVSSLEAFRTPASVHPSRLRLAGIRKPLTIPDLPALTSERGDLTPGRKVKHGAYCLKR